MIARTREGNELLSFITCVQPIIPDEDRDIPLTFTVIAAMHQDRYLLLYTPERDQWEIPGGGIEEGETPYECALRELFEETGQMAEQLTFKGLFKIRLQPKGQLEYGALYTAFLKEIKPFIANSEAERITLWNSDEPLEGHFSILSHALLDFC